ncbi:MAG: VWA domain-containing protein [Verrucomicrobiota bacterium]
MNLADFHFIRPLWLVAIPVATILWWLLRRDSDPLRGWRNAVSPALLEALTVGRDQREKWRSLSLLIIWIFAIGAVAGPTWKPEPSPFADDPVPVMLVLKAGETMSQADLTPSRMERAQLKVTDFADARKGQPLGLIAYAGSAHLVLPPTRDTSVVATMAENIFPDIMPQEGDDLAAALRLARQALANRGGSIVVFADTVNPSSLAELASARSEVGLPIHLLAIAREDTPEYDDLSEAASSLGASLTLISADGSDIDRLVSRTARAPISVAGAEGGTRWDEAGWWLVPVLVLLMLPSFRREQLITGEEAVS